MRCLNADGNEMVEGDPGHGASTTETPNPIDRRGRRRFLQPDVRQDHGDVAFAEQHEAFFRNVGSFTALW